TRFSRDWSSDVCSSDLGLARIARMRGGVREVARDADFPLGLGRVGRAGGSAEVTGVEDAGVLAVEASVLIEQLGADARAGAGGFVAGGDRKSTRLNSSHVKISYAVFCLKKKNEHEDVLWRAQIESEWYE